MPAGLARYWAKKRAAKAKRSNPRRQRARAKAKRPRVVIQKIYVRNPPRRRRRKTANPRRRKSSPLTCPVRLTGGEQKKHSAWLSRNFKRK
jgi:hypothetical protein